MLFMPLFKCLAVIYTEQDDKMKYEQKKRHRNSREQSCDREVKSYDIFRVIVYKNGCKKTVKLVSVKLKISDNVQNSPVMLNQPQKSTKKSSDIE